MVRTYPHLDDLVASAADLQVTPNMSLHNMLKRADESLTRAEADLGFARPDQAYVEYLKACHIILHIAPKHREYKIASSDRHDAWKLNKELQAKIHAKHDKFAAIKEQIKRNNEQSGVQSARLLQANGSTPRQSEQNVSIQPETKSPEQSVRKKPAIQPKPANLLARKVLPSLPDESQTVDSLAERFANLRSPTNSKKLAEQDSRPGSAGSMNANPSTSNTPVPEYTPTSSVSSEPELTKFISGPTIMQHKPAGPREMPPPRPAKIPLNTSLPDLPKPPSPTYSPSRSGPELPGLIARSSSRQIATTTSLNEALNGQSNSAQSAPSSAPVAKLDAQRISLPRRTEITPDQLVEYLKADRSQLEILLVDLRSREEFDEGHIHARNIMCIEPIILELDMATTQLEERLVISPENEQALFARRNEFDLVVFYDQASLTNHYLGGPSRSRDEQVLRAFTQAFYEFNFDKPLQRSPVLLKGGLDAWVDLMGIYSLKMNTKSNQPRRIPQRPARPGIRLVSETSSLIAKGRQNRLDSPLNQEEKQLWLDRVRGDGETLHLRIPQGDQDSKANRRLASIVPVDTQTNVVRGYDDFLRRFPSPEDIKQSMVSPVTPMSPRSTSGTIIDNPYHNFANIAPPVYEESLHIAPSRPPPAIPRKSYSGVSERVPRPPTDQVITPSIHPERPSTNDTITAASDHMYGRTGLKNLGNTCYMNSVIQCLSATAPLSRFFLDGSYKRDLTKENKLGSNGVLPEIYANVVRHLWQGQYNHISPKTFREFVGRLNPDFRTDRQQDANDFLVFLIDTLHEDLNMNFRKTRLKDLSLEEERSRESLPPQIASRIEWDRWTHNNFSRIANLFAGQHTSRLQCMTCGFKSTSYETFYSIPLEIPTKGKATVFDCLRNYTKEERLDKDNNWRCPSCKTIRETTKKITITRAPQILVIQFKRFKTSADGWMDKVKTPIGFPLAGLDITPFVAPPLGLTPEDHTPQAEAIRKLQAQHNHQPDFATTPPFKYNVYGVVNHFGSLSGGHYKALVRNGMTSSWMEFDDSRCSDFSASKVVSEAAYLLFCVRPNAY